ncbi:hypothetical protein CMUS01_03549 [Colletotrichum musicola]|uniref:Uncharacterized protein n=1 Tax=Colletotrichum musicola TaxID=2175873 RepID=A0A8H6NS15_9PEZI|nr:hypothetical protein CMUS01_03549 [Colletotrichum musicola]
MPCHGQGEAHGERAQWAWCIRMPSSSAEPVPGASSPWVTVGSQPRAELSLCRPYHNAQAGSRELMRPRDPTSSAHAEMRSEEQPRGVGWAATDSHRCFTTAMEHYSEPPVINATPGGAAGGVGAPLCQMGSWPLLEIRVLERHRVPTSDHISNERRSKAAQVRPSPDTPKATRPFTHIGLLCPHRNITRPLGHRDSRKAPSKSGLNQSVVTRPEALVSERPACARDPQ